MFPASIVFAAVAVLPSDRMAMADRLFDRGLYKEAKAEYLSLSGAEGIAPDDMLYRIAECDSALGDKAAARRGYSELLDKHPLSRHAARSRLMKAMCGTPGEMASELRLLDSDGVADDIRAAALYHLGALSGDAETLTKSIRLAPKGPYAPYAKYRRALAYSSSADPAKKRQAVSDLLEIHHSTEGDIASDSLLLAAETSYGEKRYGEASALFRRHLQAYPGSKHAERARTMAAWSDYAAGKYADAASLCGDGSGDDAAYLLAACAYATGEYAKAREMMLGYLAKFPGGKYRSAVELPLARLDFDAAEKAGDAAKAVEAAKRSVAISGSSADMMRLAWAYAKGGNAKEAESEYEKVSAGFPGTEDAAEALFLRAMGAVREKKWSRAELLLAEADSTGKNAKRAAETAYWRGVSAVMLSHGEEGSAFLRKALAAGISVDLAREANLMLADCDYSAGRKAAAKDAYAVLVRDGACARMSAAKLRAVGRFLLDRGDGGSRPEEAKVCGTELSRKSEPEWRQAGFALKGAAEESLGEFTSAAESYRSAMAEKSKTEDLAGAALALGILESRAGNHVEADRILKECVALSRSDASRRAQAYRWLARNCVAMTDYHGACAYATVILTLFDDKELADEARKILDEHQGAAK